MTSARQLGETFDAHTAAEFQSRDIDATMATMSGKPHVTHVPTMTGGHGTDAVRRFYETWFIGHWPEDTEITPLSRTVGDNRVVDEVIIRFTHDCDMPALLPGIKLSRDLDVQYKTAFVLAHKLREAIGSVSKGRVV